MKRMRNILKVFGLVALQACGMPTQQQETHVQDAALEYSYNGLQIPLSMALQEGEEALTIPENTKQELHEAWTTAEDLLEQPIARVLGESDLEVQLLDVNIRQIRNWQVDANGSLNVLGGKTKEDKAKEGAYAGLEFDGQGGSFRLSARFQIFNPETQHKVVREYVVGKPLTYWDVSVMSQVGVHLTPSQLAAAILGVDMGLAAGLGSFIDKVGAVGASVALSKGQNWLAEAVPAVEVPSQNGGRGQMVSKLSLDIAQDVFVPLCNDLLPNSETCKIKPGFPVESSAVQEAGRYENMQVVASTLHPEKEGVRDVYRLFVVAPKPSNNHVDFLPSKSPMELKAYVYKQTKSSKVSWERVGGKLQGPAYATLEQQVQPSYNTCPPETLGPQDRCLEFHVLRNFWGQESTAINEGMANYMLSLKNADKVIVR